MQVICQRCLWTLIISPIFSFIFLSLSIFPTILVSHYRFCRVHSSTILLTKATAAQNEVALSYHNVCGLYFPAIVFVSTTILVPHYRFCRVHSSTILLTKTTAAQNEVALSYHSVRGLYLYFDDGIILRRP